MIEEDIFPSVLNRSKIYNPIIKPQLRICENLARLNVHTYASMRQYLMYAFEVYQIELRLIFRYSEINHFPTNLYKLLF